MLRELNNFGKNSGLYIWQGDLLCLVLTELLVDHGLYQLGQTRYTERDIERLSFLRHQMNGSFVCHYFVYNIYYVTTTPTTPQYQTKAETRMIEFQRFSTFEFQRGP
jgi:hypothetical protein